MILDSCEPRDSDSCLQASPGWGSTYKCTQISVIWQCTRWGRDVKRCCPKACNSGKFTKEDCDSYSGQGTCIYPNDAQCPGLMIQDI